MMAMMRASRTTIAWTPNLGGVNAQIAHYTRMQIVLHVAAEWVEGVPAKK